MKKSYILIISFVFSLTLLAQYPRNKVVFEEGTGTW